MNICIGKNLVPYLLLYMYIVLLYIRYHKQRLKIEKKDYQTVKKLPKNIIFLVDCCLSFGTFSFGHCVVCSSSIYRFWWSLWYLQILLSSNWLYKFEFNWQKSEQFPFLSHYWQILCEMNKIFFSQNLNLIEHKLYEWPG